MKLILLIPVDRTITSHHAQVWGMAWTNWTSIKPGLPVCIPCDKIPCGCLATAVILELEKGTGWIK